MSPTVLTDTIYQIRLEIKREWERTSPDRSNILHLSKVLANLQRAELDYIRGKKCSSQSP